MEVLSPGPGSWHPGISNLPGILNLPDSSKSGKVFGSTGDQF